MKRRGLVRFQIFLLVALAVVVIIRVVKGPPPPEGLIVFTEMEPHDLYYKAFELEERAEMVIQATGSFDQEAMPVGLAAQGWIVRRSRGPGAPEVVWRMDPRTVEQGRGSLALVQGDTLTFEAGRYDVYFASYGQTESRRRRPKWRSEAERWQFVLRPVDETAPARPLFGQRLSDLETPVDNLVWRQTRLRNGHEDEHLFEVKRPTPLTIYAVGEIDDEPQDYAWIEDAATGAHIWGLSKDNTVPAGGVATNRRFEGTVTLQPGAYRAYTKTNRRHSFNHWQGNPPLDPASWGLTLSTPDADAVSAFDPWVSREPLASFTRVSNNARLAQRFEVSEPIHVVIYAVGEITGRDDDEVYDFGELLKEEPDRKQRIWKMSRDRSKHAGGGDKNRVEVVFLRLDPGIYTFRYQTDESHAYESWNTSRPDYTERWGATLFPMAASLDSGLVELLETPEAERWAAPNAPHDARRAPMAQAGDVIVAWKRLHGNVDETRAFGLQYPAKLHIQALGEITGSNHYDYGWIEKLDTGETVWEMTLDNTFAAGGGSSNRRFDGIVMLPPGPYAVHYKTDSSHHYGAFGDDEPENPEDWGITIRYVDSVDEDEH